MRRLVLAASLITAACTTEGGDLGTELLRPDAGPGVPPPPPPPPPPGARIQRFECTDVPIGAPGEFAALARIDGLDGARDGFAVLRQTAAGAELRVMAADGSTRFVHQAQNGEVPRALHTYRFRDHTMIAIGLSNTLGPREELAIHVFEMVNGTRIERTDLRGVCGTWMCSNPIDRECRIMVEFHTEVGLRSADLDLDGLPELIAGSSSDLPVIVYNASPGPQPYADGACTCGQFGQPAGKLELPAFGGPGDTPGALGRDLVLGASAGIYVRYGEPADATRLECGQSFRIGPLGPVRAMTHARFACPASDQTCPAFDDVAYVGSTSLSSGTFDDPGFVAVIHGAPEDLSLLNTEAPMPPVITELAPSPRDPKGPKDIVATDLDGDDAVDLAVLYTYEPMVVAWANDGRGGFSEIAAPIDVDACGSPCGYPSTMVHGRFDAVEGTDLAVLCGTDLHASVRVLSPVLR